MDMDLLKADLDTALKQLPPAVLSQLSDLVLTHRDIFAERMPVVIEALMPHIKAVVMEVAMGIVEVSEIEAAVMEVLARNGMKPNAQTRQAG